MEMQCSEDHKRFIYQVVSEGDADVMAVVLCLLSRSICNRKIELNSSNVWYIKDWSELDDRRIENAMQWLESDDYLGPPFIKRYVGENGIPVVEIVKKGNGYQG